MAFVNEIGHVCVNFSGGASLRGDYAIEANTLERTTSFDASSPPSVDSD
jgi:hypothetical protein